MKPATFDFFFDLASGYSYLAHSQVEPLAHHCHRSPTGKLAKAVLVLDAPEVHSRSHGRRWLCDERSRRLHPVA